MSPRTTSPPTRPPRTPTTPPRSRTKACETLVRAGERAASLGAAAEARRYFEQAAALDGRPVASRRRCSTGPATWPARAGDPEAARQLLEQCDRDLRGRRATRMPPRGSRRGWPSSIASPGHRDEALERLERAFEVIVGRRAGRGPRPARRAAVAAATGSPATSSGPASGPSSRSTSPRRRASRRPSRSRCARSRAVLASRGHTAGGARPAQAGARGRARARPARGRAHLLLHPLRPLLPTRPLRGRARATSTSRSHSPRRIGQPARTSGRSLAERTYAAADARALGRGAGHGDEFTEEQVRLRRRRAERAPVRRRDPLPSRRARRGPADLRACSRGWRTRPTSRTGAVGSRATARAAARGGAAGGGARGGHGRRSRPAPTLGPTLPGRQAGRRRRARGCARASATRRRSRSCWTGSRSCRPAAGPPFLEAQALRFRARLSGRRGRPGRRGRRGSVRIERSPFWLAVTQLEQAEALGGGDAAELLVAEARATFERLGATPWLERAAGAGAEAEVAA